jgi:hypothetical protein
MYRKIPVAAIKIKAENRLPAFTTISKNPCSAKAPAQCRQLSDAK